MACVFIIGSCISRDAFNENASDFFKIDTYVARTSLASAFSNEVSAEIDLEKINSKFQRSMVDIDINKRLQSLLMSTNADVILLDAIDERLNLFQFKNGSICTLSNEFLESGFDCSSENGNVVYSRSNDFFKLWEHGWCSLIDILKKRNILDRLVVNNAFWSIKHEDGTDFLPNISDKYISDVNIFLTHIYTRMSHDLTPDQFINFPQNLICGATNHKWGSSPFHYVDKFYLYIIKSLVHRITPSGIVNGELLLDLRCITLTSSIFWLDVKASLGATIFLEAETASESGTSNRRALFCIDIEENNDNILLDGFAISHDPDIGMYHYLSTGANKEITNCSFTLPALCSNFRIGLRSWMPENEIILARLNLTRVNTDNI